MSIELKELCDHDYQRLLLDPRPIECGDHGETAFCIVKIEPTEHWGDSPEYDLHFSIVAVSPKMVIGKELQSHLDSYGQDRAWFDELPEEGKLEFLAECGCCATLWQGTAMEDEEDARIEDAKKELLAINMLFGFYMDKPQNAIGATGWNWIKGDIMGNISRK